MELHTQAHLPMLRGLLQYRQAALQADVHAARTARDAGARRLVADDLQLARDVAELRDVDDALGRLDAGTYGDCAGCGEAIPASRLMAQPAVRLCAACQATREGLC